MPANNTNLIHIGPALGNVPTPDYYLRIKQNIEGLQARLTDVLQLASTAHPLTADQLKQIQNALQAGGPNPLNLTALPGIVLQPQASTIPAVTKLPATGSSKEGQVVLYRHVIWRFSATTHAWSPASTIVIVDYSYNLVNYAPAQYAPGVLFVGIDSSVLYVEEDIVTGSTTTPTWVPLITGSIALPHADRHSTGTLTTAANNNGSPAVWGSGEHFRPEMVGQQINIAGNLYPVASYNNNNLITLSTNAGNIAGANYTFEYPSINYPVGTIFIETDRNVEYYAGNANGVVNIAGNNVTLVSGPKFDLYWRNILLGNNSFSIASVAANRTALVVATPPGNNNNVNYSVPSGSWFYATGQYSNNLNGIPADLESVDANYLYAAIDYNHSYRWSGNNWNFAPGDGGSAFLVAAFDSPPRGGPWALCDGNTVLCATDAGGTAGVLTKDLTTDIFIKGGTPGLPQNATPATWAANAHTDSNNLAANGTTDSANLTIGNENNHTHHILTVAQNFLTGVSANFNPGNSNATLSLNTTASPGTLSNDNTENGTPHNHSITPNPHTHNFNFGANLTFGLSNNNAVLNAPSETDGGLPKRIALAWYIRR